MDPTIKFHACIHCGTPGMPDEAFCRNCGRPLQSAPESGATPTQPPAQSLPPTTLGQAPAPQTSPGQGHGYAPPLTTMVAPPPVISTPSASDFRPASPPRKRRSPLLIGCLIFVALIGVTVVAGGIYLWRATSYSPPERVAADMPKTVSGTMTEFPVDNDPNEPARPATVETESLDEKTSKSATASNAKLPPGTDRSRLAKGATTMTTSVYKPRPKNPASQPATAAAGGEVYINVLTLTPNQPKFTDELIASMVQATNGTRTGVNLTSAQGATYTGARIRSSQSYICILTKQGGDVLIIIHSTDASMQPVVDRLASNVGNAGGLMDYPEVKDSLWTLPAATPAGLTMTGLSTLTGQQLENSLASGIGEGGDTREILAQMRPFIPARLTNVRYLDSSQREWVVLNFEYESSFQAWRTWLLARSVLGLGGGQSTTVREVTAIYLDQDGQRMMIFQKGPYLVLLSGPTAGPFDTLIALGNGIQV